MQSLAHFAKKAEKAANHPKVKYSARLAVYLIYAFVATGFIGDVFVIYELHLHSISEWSWSVTATHPLISVFALPVFMGWGYLCRDQWIAVGLVFATYAHIFTVMITL